MKPLHPRVSQASQHQAPLCRRHPQPTQLLSSSAPSTGLLSGKLPASAACFNACTSVIATPHSLVSFARMCACWGSGGGGVALLSCAQVRSTQFSASAFGVGDTGVLRQRAVPIGVSVRALCGMLA